MKGILVFGASIVSLIRQIPSTRVVDFGCSLARWPRQSPGETRALARKVMNLGHFSVVTQVIRHEPRESRFAEAWRNYGAYRGARAMLSAAIVEDQFAATTRPHRGATVMTIHRAKGKEFDEVIVFEGAFLRYLQPRAIDAERSARFNLHVATTRARTL
jgi:superfamily I DNA/RNA helicase